MVTPEHRPVRPTYGRVPGFGRPFRIEPGACPTCGQRPACDPPAKTSAEATAPHCRDSRCRLADVPHLVTDCTPAH